MKKLLLPIVYFLLCVAIAPSLFAQPGTEKVTNGGFDIIRDITGSSSRSGCTSPAFACYEGFFNSNAAGTTVTNNTSHPCMTNNAGNSAVTHLWFTPTRGTPDFYHQSNTVANFDVPFNIRTCSTVAGINHAGVSGCRAYTGIWIRENANTCCEGSDLQLREYISQQLAQPLWVGKKYRVSFKVYYPDCHYIACASGIRKGTIKKLGAILTTMDPSASQYTALSSTTSSTLQYVEQTVTTGWGKDVSGRTNQWELFEMDIVIQNTNKNFITIGNFQGNIPTSDWVPDVSTPLIDDATEIYTYYFIDEVSIKEQDCVCIEPMTINYKSPLITNVIANSTESGYFEFIRDLTKTDQNKCCYTLNLYSGSKTCAFNKIKITVNHVVTELDIMYPAFGAESGMKSLNVCIEREDILTNPIGKIEFFYDDGNILTNDKLLNCDKEWTFECNCSNCSELNREIDIVPHLTPNAENCCCWDIILQNKGECDTKISNDLGNEVLATIQNYNDLCQPGSSITGVNGVTTWDNVNSKFVFTTNYHNFNLIASSALKIGTFCIPESNDISVSLTAKDYNIDPDNCPLLHNEDIVCDNNCCYVTNFSAEPCAECSTDINRCCVNLKVQVNGTCTSAASIEFQVLTDTWSNLYGPVSWNGTTTVIQQICNLLKGRNYKYRMVIRNSSGTVICEKDITYRCPENPCCDFVKLDYASIVKNGECCNVITAKVRNCIKKIIVKTFNGTSTQTVDVKNITPPDLNTDLVYEYSLIHCGAGIKKFFIEFLDETNTVICNREIIAECPCCPEVEITGVTPVLINQSGPFATCCYDIDLNITDNECVSALEWSTQHDDLQSISNLSTGSSTVRICPTFNYGSEKIYINFRDVNNNITCKKEIEVTCDIVCCEKIGQPTATYASSTTVGCCYDINGNISDNNCIVGVRFWQPNFGGIGGGQMMTIPITGNTYSITNLCVLSGTTLITLEFITSTGEICQKTTNIDCGVNCCDKIGEPNVSYSPFPNPDPFKCCATVTIPIEDESCFTHYAAFENNINCVDAYSSAPLPVQSGLGGIVVELCYCALGGNVTPCFSVWFYGNGIACEKIVCFGGCDGSIIGKQSENSTISNTSIVQHKGVTATLAPNPTSTMSLLTYTLDEDVNIDINLFDNSGRKIFSIDEGQRKKGEHSIEVNTGSIPAGSYIVTLVYNNVTLTLPLTIVR